MSVYVVKLYYNAWYKKYRIKFCSTDSQWFVSELTLYLTFRNVGQVCVKDSCDSVHGAVDGWKYKTSGMLHPRKLERKSTPQCDLKISNVFLNSKDPVNY